MSFTEKVDLNDEILFMQVQDMVEVCSKKFDYSEACIKKLEVINPNIKVNCVGDCENALIKRDYIEVTVTLL